jgi:hypothetical protein
MWPVGLYNIFPHYLKNDTTFQKKIHTAEPLVPELSAFEVELAIEKLKGCKSLGID